MRLLPKHLRCPTTRTRVQKTIRWKATPFPSARSARMMLPSFPTGHHLRLFCICRECALSVAHGDARRRILCVEIQRLLSQDLWFVRRQQSNERGRVEKRRRWKLQEDWGMDWINFGNFHSGVNLFASMDESVYRGKIECCSTPRVRSVIVLK